MAGDSYDETTVMSLLEALWANEPSGWRRLFELYTPFVYRYCRMAGLSPDDAADVGQDVFHSVSRGIARFQRDETGTTFRGWLHTITRNKIIDHFRRRQRQPTVSMNQAGIDLVDETTVPGPMFDDIANVDILSPTAYRAIDEARSEFEQKTWQAFWMTAVEDRRASDVAATLEMSVNAVYLARSRLLRRLREKLGDVVPD